LQVALRAVIQARRNNLGQAWAHFENPENRCCQQSLALLTASVLWILSYYPRIIQWSIFVITNAITKSNFNT